MQKSGWIYEERMDNTGNKKDRRYAIDTGENATRWDERRRPSVMHVLKIG
jgi:hypothetical protein